MYIYMKKTNKKSFQLENRTARATFMHYRYGLYMDLEFTVLLLLLMEFKHSFNYYTHVCSIL